MILIWFLVNLISISVVVVFSFDLFFVPFVYPVSCVGSNVVNSFFDH